MQSVAHSATATG